MKKTIAFVSLIALLNVFGQAEIIKNYDRFAKTTTVSVRPRGSVLIKQPHLYLTAIYNGQKFTGEITSIGFWFISVTHDSRFSKCNGTNFLIDGEPYSPGDAQYELEEDIHAATETLGYEIPFEVIKKMAAANKIEVQICHTEFKISKREMKDLKEFVRELTLETQLEVQIK